MDEDTAEYEKSEAIAIADGKAALARAPWLRDRRVSKCEGFFVELIRNDKVHPDHYAVHCVDGNGTKLFLAAWEGNYRRAPIDGIAMNVNDMATIIHSDPDTLDLYMACQRGVEENHMGAIMNGFVDALERIRTPNAPWNVNTGKFETASLDEMISLGEPGSGVDFGIVLTGFIQKDKVPLLDPKPGNYIVGVTSSGLHSNGFTDSRHIMLTSDVEPREEWKPQYKGRFRLDDKPEILGGQTVLEAMREPTALYFADAITIGQELDERRIYGVNITGNGLLNFNRVGQGVSFEITDPLKPLPIHQLLMEEFGWSVNVAYTKQNRGMGFAYITPTQEVAEEIVRIVNGRGENHARIVGEVAQSDEAELRTTLYLPDGTHDFIGYNA